MDLVSVIVPVYNAEKYLKKCVDSILCQSYKNIEVILVDDGSTDTCPSLCDDYEKFDERVHVIHKENGGLCDARNTGINYARGKYVTFVDNDDLVNNEFIEILYNLCEQYGCDIAQCDFLMINESSVLLPPQKTMTVKVYDRNEIINEFCQEANLVKYWVVWNKMYRRELFDGVQFPVGRIHDDMYTTHKLLWKAEKMAVTNIYLYYYFQREGSITGKKNSIVERIDVIEALREEISFFKKNNLDDAYAFMLLKVYNTVYKVWEKKEDFVGYLENKEYYDKIIEEYVVEAEEIKKIYLGLPNIGMLTKISSLYSWLSQEEKEKYKKIYGSKVSGYAITYQFPKEKIDKHESVVLYGAGVVGQAFYCQILENGYCHLVAWVDNGFKNHVKMGLPVQPIDSLFQTEFDKVIISVLNKNIAYEIAQNLKEWGIEESKIIIALPVPVDRGNKMLTEFLTDTKKIECSSGKRRFFLVNTPDHDNLGDHLLTMGALSFLQKYFPMEEIIEITGRQWDACREDIINKIGSQDVIFIVGGGYMGDLWPVQDSRVKEILAEFKNNQIIFLPQTFFYHSNNEKMINSDTDFYNKLDRVIFIHREKHSYDFFRTNIAKRKKNVCFPDTALYLNQRKESAERSGGLVCLRMDKESLHDKNREKLLGTINSVCKNVNVIDTVLDKSILRSEREIEVNKMLDIISHSEILITDRLHAMVMAVITGTPCIAMDNVSKKVSGVYEWIKDLDYITCVHEDDINEGLICKYMEKKHNLYDNSIVLSHFDRMYKTIKEWLD